jgi:hypothetical protein
MEVRKDDLLHPEKVEGGFRLGGSIDKEQIAAFAQESNSPTANDILEHLDEFNAEIPEPVEVLPHPEQRGRPLPKPTTPKVRGREGVLPSPVARADAPAPRTVAIRESTPKKTEKRMERSLEEDIAAIGGEESERGKGGAVDEVSMREEILSHLKEIPGAPTDEQIAGMKKQFGEDNVHVIAFGKGDVYIFTCLKRSQWQAIQKKMQELQGQGNAAPAALEDKLKETVVQHCVVWPKLPLEFFYNSKAGIVDTIYQMIMLQSYFIAPQQAVFLTTKL